MGRVILSSLVLCGLYFTNYSASANPVTDLLSEYKTKGASSFDSSNAKQMWTQKFSHRKSGKERSCATCHTANLKRSGKHAKTKKVIKPLAPSVNSERLTEVKKIRKWFKRNCKWTLGRECTAQEKGDFLVYLNKL